MNQFFRVFLTFIAFSLTMWSFGQSPNDHWAQKMKNPNVNFYEVQEAFNTFWEGKEVTKGQGYKQYKRWEQFWEQRLYPSGERIAPDHVYNEWMNAQKSMVQVGGGGMWTYFGNTSVPTNGGGAGRINMVRTHPTDANTYFACAPGGGLWKSTNAGGSWSLMNTDNLTSIGVTDVVVDPTNTNVIYMATGDGDAGDTYALGVLKSTDGGNTWNPSGLSWTVQQTRRISRLIMHPANSSILFAATSNGLYRTTDAGGSWTQIVSGNFKDVEINPGDATIVYAVSNSSNFYRSTDTGASFSAITSGVPSSGVSRLAIAVSPDAPNTVYILAGASDSGFYGFYRSTDAGLNFTLMANSPNMMGWNVDGSGTGGQAWYDLAIASDPLNADVVYIGGVNVWKTSDGGSNWTCVGHWYGASGTPYVHADIHGMHFVPGTSTLLVGCDGGVFRSTDGGNSFQDLSANLEIGQIYRLGTAQTNVNMVISGWQDNGTNLKNGANWSRVIGGDGFESAIDYTNQNIQYGALYYGQIFKSTGGGFNTIVNSNGTGVNQGGAWVTPYILSPNDPNTMYVGKSGVYKSTDGGANWSTLAELPGGDCNGLAVAKSNENYIYASKGSTLYRTTDGTNFSAVSGLPGLYITYIAVDPADENRVWVTLSGYTNGDKVYYSADAGTSWTNYSTGLPNIPANCIAYMEGSSDALYLGTDAGVYYRDQSFGSWQLYNFGLPNVVVSELEIHYSSNTIVASTYGRGIWHAPLYTLPATDGALVEMVEPVGTYCDSSVPNSLTIGNFGSNNITSMDISYSLDGGAIQVYNWTGTMVTGGTTTVTLPNLTAAYGAHSVSYWISAVNGTAGDDSGLNDTQSASFFVSGNDQTITLTLTTDCWAVETSWDLVDQFGTVIYSGTGYSNYTVNTIDMCVLDGCYTLNVYDSYGDGMTGLDFGGCSQNGDFYLTDESGYVLVQMETADFGFGVSYEFCVPFVVIEGCTDPIADNYDSTANSDDGSCIYSCTFVDLEIFTDCWGNETSWELYDSFGTVIYAGPASSYGNQTTYNELMCLDDGCYDLVMLDSFGDGMDGVSSGCAVNGYYILTDEFGNILAQIDANPNYGSSITHNFCLPAAGTPGCMDSAACNYDSTATTDDGSCTYPGCIDTSACNYNSAVGCDDGSCTYPGCTVLVACNYNAIAGCDDGSCTFPGCNNPAACNYDSTAGCFDGSCTFPGCTDTNACNYSASAGCDDGSCTYPGCTDNAACNYNSVAGCNDGSCTYPGCDDVNACNYNAAAGCNDGSCTYPGCMDTSACNYDSTAGCDDGSCDYSCYGCTDSTACNFNSAATIEDGTCTYPGCIDSAATNYDSTAGCDDGSCTYLCEGDFNNDGVVDVQDLLLFLGGFGCMSNCGEMDLNSDGVVNTSDMLDFLGLFGTQCF